jgi:hypothetical protein
MSKLETFNKISRNKINNKYEVTKLIESPDILNSYHRNLLKDFSPDEATFAYEESRKNYDSTGKINLHYNGRRNDKEPFQPDLFLGFTDKDPRSIHNEPLMGKYQEQMWHRKDNYKMSFKDDADNSVPTAGISESKMQKNKKTTYSGFKERYKNFEESNDAWTNSFNAIQSKQSKVTLHDADDTIPNLNDVQDLKKRRDYVATLSLQALPIGWESTPDHKIKIAQYNKLLTTKNLLDTNIRKNKNEQLKDDKSNKLDLEQKLVNKLILLIDNFKNKKQSDFSEQDTKYKESNEDLIRKINKNKEHFKNNEINTTELDDKKIKLMEVLNDKLFKIKDYVAPLNTIMYNSEQTGNPLYSDNANNQEQNNQSSKTKNDIFNEILYKTIISTNQLNKSNTNNQINKLKKSNITVLSNNNSEFIYNNSLINDKALQQNNNSYEIINYKNMTANMTNNYDSVLKSQENKLNKYIDAIANHHRKPNVQSNDALHADDFETDTDFNTSGFKDRKTGFIGSKYMFNKKEYEKEENTINDSTNLKMKSKY